MRTTINNININNICIINMKIYILRHEDRTMDRTFFSPLTEEGLNNSIRLIEQLNKHNINYIFSSPFIRTLQTVYPYSKQSGVKINPEHSLSEIQHPRLIPVESYKINLPSYIAEQFNCNPGYISMLDPSNHVYPENEETVAARVKAFLTRLIREHVGKDHNILIVTHQIIINSILKIATRRYSDLKINIAYNYPKGALSKVFDTEEFMFEPINWKFTL
jgi:broad specificity phosphatase PhoE